MSTDDVPHIPTDIASTTVHSLVRISRIGTHEAREDCELPHTYLVVITTSDLGLLLGNTTFLAVQL
jgi:hypothetical protein